MAEDNNNLFDVNAPAPTPITLTFGEEGAPEIPEETPTEKEVVMLRGGVLKKNVSKRIETKAYLINEDFLVRSGEALD